jgi:hypothetical protein
MAAGTHFVRCFVVVSDAFRHVGLVAAAAVILGDICRVIGGASTRWHFVALGTLGYFTMLVMAEGAVERSMLGLVILQLDDLLSMAGQTWIGHIVAELYILRGMGILVATEATAQFVVGLVSVTHAALRDRPLDSWWVTNVTILAANTRFVSATLCFNVCRWFGMAFLTVRIQQFGSI